MTFEICFLNHRGELLCLLAAPFSSDSQAARYAELVMASRFCRFDRAEVRNVEAEDDVPLIVSRMQARMPEPPRSYPSAARFGASPPLP
jgi:hypothetical protein